MEICFLGLNYSHTSGQVPGWTPFLQHTPLMRHREAPSYREDGISRATPLDSHVPAAEWPRSEKERSGDCTNHLGMTKI